MSIRERPERNGIKLFLFLQNVTLKMLTLLLETLEWTIIVLILIVLKSTPTNILHSTNAGKAVMKQWNVRSSPWQLGGLLLLQYLEEVFYCEFHYYHYLGVGSAMCPVCLVFPDYQISPLCSFILF